MTWQRHVRMDVDLRQKLIDQTPRLKLLIAKFSIDEPTTKTDRSQGEDDANNWVFEWAKNRHEMRKEEEKNSWIYYRWRSRDEMRHQQNDDHHHHDRYSPLSASKWLFRRGKERERKREEMLHDNHQNNRGRRGGEKAKDSTKSSQRRR